MVSRKIVLCVFSAGQGGEDGDNAELHASYQHLQVFKNTLGGVDNLKLYSNQTAYNKWLIIKVTGGGVAAFSDLGLFYREYNNYLLQFSQSNEWYLGLNRVVEPYDGPSPIGNRYGQGLCSVCIEWNKDGNLDHPRTVPTLPPVDGGDTVNGGDTSTSVTNIIPVNGNGGDTGNTSNTFNPAPGAAAKITNSLLCMAVLLIVSIIPL